MIDSAFIQSLKQENPNVGEILKWYLNCPLDNGKHITLFSIKHGCSHLPWARYFDRVDLIKMHEVKIITYVTTPKVDPDDPLFYVLETLYHEREDLRKFIEGLDNWLIADVIPASSYERDGLTVEVERMEAKFLKIKSTIII